MLSSTLLTLLILALASHAQADETTVDTVAVDGEMSMEETVEIIENDEPSSNSDEDKGLDNTEVNCHKCLRASFNCRKPKFNAKHPIYCEEKCNIILVDAETEKESGGEASEATNTTLPDLGPLGNLFKFLVVATTFQ